MLTVLSGMTYKEHLQDNLRTSGEELGFLEDVARRMADSKNIPCTACGYCMPCPYGVDIPALFVHYNKCVNHGLVVSDRLDSRYAEARRAFLIGYDRSAPRLRQAARCIGCGQCAPKCPQGIDIPSQMRDEVHRRLRGAVEARRARPLTCFRPAAVSLAKSRLPRGGRRLFAL